jgi:HlyD family secretion protein
MKKILIFGSIAIALIFVLIWFGKKNNASVIDYETEKAFKTTIIKKSVATGKVIPVEEIEIKQRSLASVKRARLKEKKSENPDEKKK